MTSNEWPVISGDPEIQGRYAAMRQRGEAHSMAEMLAMRVPTGTKNTDKAFMQGFSNGEFMRELRPNEQQKYAYLARKAGVSIAGKTYKAGLARYAGDPRAWVSDIDDARRLVGKRYDEKQREADKPPIRLAEDIVQEFVQQELQETPLADPRELREKVIEKHGAPAC